MFPILVTHVAKTPVLCNFELRFRRGPGFCWNSINLYGANNLLVYCGV